ncbi:MAG: YlxR family protein [Firmicutes bacterium]|nr:YlxR family protein [Alicyclobacillaceae bacterium]MCL6496815.1 YlxR family protein [Bacillota bacterium]
MATNRKAPMRTCIACRQTRPKRELVRVVRTPEARLVVDPRGKLSGRGAYVCPTVDCVRRAVEGRRFERALAVAVPPEVVESLLEGIGAAREQSTP